MLQKLVSYIQQLNARLYVATLVPATVVYYLLARMFQDSLHLWNPDVADALPGFPVLPEPYEIPLYLAGYVVIPVVALIFYFIFQKVVSVIASPDGGVTWRSRSDAQNEISTSTTSRNDNSVFFGFLDSVSKHGMTRRVVTAIGILFFVIVAGIYLFRPDLIHFIISYFQRQSVWHLIWLLFTKRIYVVKIAFAAGVGVGLLALIRGGINLAWIRTIDASKALKRFVPYFFIFIAVLVFHPNFPSQEGFTNFIVSPAHELLNGKPLLYETSSVYGILNIYFTALLFKIGLPVSFQAFSTVLVVFYFAFFVTLYIVVYQWFRSRLFALLATWFAVVLGFFLLTDPSVTPYDFPGQGAFRQGMYVFVALLLVLWHSRKKSIYRECALALSAVLLFWNIDTGVYIVFATFATLALGEWSKFECSFWERIRTCILLGLRHLGYILTVFGVIHFINYAVYGTYPNWGLELVDISTFNSGYGKLPLPAFGLFELHVLVYMSFALWIISKLIRKQSIHPLVFFFTIYGVFSFQYYIGNSAWSYLNFISIPMLVLTLYAYKNYFIDHEGRNVSGRLVAASFLGLLVFAGMLSVAKIPTVFAYRDYSNISLNYLESGYDRALDDDAKYIRKHFRETRIPMFHFYDGTLLTRAGKINAFYLQNGDQRLYSLYDDMLIVFKRQLQGLKNQVDEMKPQYILITNAPDARQYEFEAFVKRSYTLDTRLQTLNIYKRSL